MTDAPPVRKRRFVEPKSATVEWYTPASVFQSMGGGLFDLDVCSPPRELVPWIPARRAFVLPEHDGLREPWDGMVWMNPPFGAGIGKWVARFTNHGNGVALLPNRADAAWWQGAAEGTDVIRVLRGRTAFIPGAGAAWSEAPPFGCALFGVGAGAEVVRRCSLPGVTLVHADAAPAAGVTAHGPVDVRDLGPA